jgi:hypothetical protein
MRALLIVAVLAVSLAADASRGARAQWCAFYDEYTYNCGFRTFQQCLDTISGVGGMCRRDRRSPDSGDARREDERRDQQRRERPRY